MIILQVRLLIAFQVGSSNDSQRERQGEIYAPHFMGKGIASNGIQVVLIVLISQDDGQYEPLPAVNGRNTINTHNNYG